LWLWLQRPENLQPGRGLLNSLDVCGVALPSALLKKAPFWDVIASGLGRKRMVLDCLIFLLPVNRDQGEFIRFLA
jgi:hypothetical protein